MTSVLVLATGNSSSKKSCYFFISISGYEVDELKIRYDVDFSPMNETSMIALSVTDSQTEGRTKW